MEVTSADLFSFPQEAEVSPAAAAPLPLVSEEQGVLVELHQPAEWGGFDGIVGLIRDHALDERGHASRTSQCCAISLNFLN